VGVSQVAGKHRVYQAMEEDNSVSYPNNIDLIYILCDEN
jgi:hypothetical protein